MVKLLRTDYSIGAVPGATASEIASAEKSMQRTNKRNAKINKTIIEPLNRFLAKKENKKTKEVKISDKKTEETPEQMLEKIEINELKEKVKEKDENYLYDLSCDSAINSTQVNFLLSLKDKKILENLCMNPSVNKDIKNKIILDDPEMIIPILKSDIHLPVDVRKTIWEIIKDKCNDFNYSENSDFLKESLKSVNFVSKNNSTLKYYLYLVCVALENEREWDYWHNAFLEPIYQGPLSMARMNMKNFYDYMLRHDFNSIDDEKITLALKLAYVLPNLSSTQIEHAALNAIVYFHKTGDDKVLEQLMNVLFTSRNLRESRELLLSYLLTMPDTNILKSVIENIPLVSNHSRNIIKQVLIDNYNDISTENMRLFIEYFKKNGDNSLLKEIQENEIKELDISNTCKMLNEEEKIEIAKTTTDKSILRMLAKENNPLINVEIAKNKNIPYNVIDDLIETKNYTIIDSLINNPSVNVLVNFKGKEDRIPEDLLHSFLRSPNVPSLMLWKYISNENYIDDILSNPNINLDMIKYIILNHPDSISFNNISAEKLHFSKEEYYNFLVEMNLKDVIVFEIKDNPEMTSKELKCLVCNNSQIATMILTHPNCTNEIENQLSEFKNNKISVQIAKYTKQKDVIKKLLSDPDEKVRMKLAENENLTKFDMLELSKDKSVKVRASLATNFNIYPVILGTLVGDADPGVKIAAMNNPRRKLIVPSSQYTPESMLIDIAKSSKDIEILNAIATNPRCNKKILQELLNNNCLHNNQLDNIINIIINNKNEELIELLLDLDILNATHLISLVNNFINNTEVINDKLIDKIKHNIISNIDKISYDELEFIYKNMDLKNNKELIISLITKKEITPALIKNIRKANINEFNNILIENYKNINPENPEVLNYLLNKEKLPLEVELDLRNKIKNIEKESLSLNNKNKLYEETLS